MKKLDLGCGNSKKPGFIGLDSLKLAGVDIVHNLNIFPYPFKDNEIDEIYMDNVLEHLKNPMKVLEEIFRISRNNAKITISVPYFRSWYAFIDPTHKNFFGVAWFNYFDPNNLFYKKYSYTDIKLGIVKIEFDKEWKRKKYYNIFHKGLIAFAERFPIIYESKISHILPLNSLTFYLKVIKDAE